MELGKKIKEFRLKAGLTQEQLGDRLGVGAQAVSKWETCAAMPDITQLPRLAETFGVSIDDLFDLTVSQRLSRIENRLDIEQDLPEHVFREYEDFLKTQINAETYKKRATELIAYLYWHRMDANARLVSRYAREAVRMAPEEKKCQWMLQKAENHAAWDWNIANHSKAIAFYREISDGHPDLKLPCYYLLDNLIADHRADEAEKVLQRLCGLKDADPIVTEIYRAHIALARFDAAEADRIVEALVEKHGDSSACLFEAAQYCALKCDYARAVEYYEKSFEAEERRPRYVDALQGIANIYEIMGRYGLAAKTCSRIVSLMETEWGMTEETELADARRERDRLLAMSRADG